MRRVLIIAVLAAAVLPAVAQAATKTLSASSGAVSATLTYDEGPGGLGPDTFSNEQLSIAQGGTSYYNQPVTSGPCVPGCQLGGFGSQGPLEVTNLEGNGQPDVLLDLYTGGAHCCSVVQVFWFDPGVMAYEKAERNFGDPGASIVDLAGNGKLELESADDRFAYQFAAYAFDWLPIQIFRFSAGRFIDTTDSFPAAIRVDADAAWKTFTQLRHQQYGNGAIAAWAADEYRLGKRALVASTLAREQRLHYLESGGFGPHGEAFIKALGRFLRALGYG